MSQSTFEFTGEQNALLRVVAMRMRIFAALMAVSSVLLLAFQAYQLMAIGSSIRIVMVGLIGSAVVTGIYIVIAVFTLVAAASVQAVVTSEGDDIGHMITAIRSLKTLFGIQYWMILVMLLGIVLLTILWISWGVLSK